MMLWKHHVQLVSDDGLPARPVWDGGIPRCSEDCPHHDGKRCQLLGLRPGNICEPVVGEMGKFLDELDGPSLEQGAK